jgi:hypothetical protein
MTTTPTITAPLTVPHRIGRTVLAALATLVLVIVAAATFAIGRVTAPGSSAPTTVSSVSPAQPARSQIAPVGLTPSEIAHCHPVAC